MSIEVRALLFAVVAACAPLLGCASQPAAPTAAPARQTVELHYAGGKVSGATGRVKVALGATVALQVTSDTADEVHLHGYDKMVDVPAGGAATVTFVADMPGVFEVEMENHGTQLVQLEVR